MTESPWSIAAAKAELSRLVRAAHDRPQVIENRGRPVAVVLSAEAYQRVTESAQVGDRWRAVLDLSAELRASGGTTLKLPPRRARRSPFASR